MCYDWRPHCIGGKSPPTSCSGLPAVLATVRHRDCSRASDIHRGDTSHLRFTLRDQPAGSWDIPCGAFDSHCGCARSRTVSRMACGSHRSNHGSESRIEQTRLSEARVADSRPAAVSPPKARQPGVFTCFILKTRFWSESCEFSEPSSSFSY